MISLLAKIIYNNLRLISTKSLPKHYLYGVYAGKEFLSEKEFDEYQKSNVEMGIKDDNAIEISRGTLY